MTAHIPASELALYATNPDAVQSDRQRAIHAHLSACTDCADTFDSFISTLEEEEDDERFLTSDATEATLAYARRVEEEDNEADILLKDYFAEPEKAAYRNLAAQRRFLHGGVVRRLAQRAFDVCTTEPLYALTFADAAIAVAEAIPESAYPRNVVHDLRGRAWKERANALTRLGDPKAALDSLDRAERAYKKLTSNTLGLGNVALARAAAYFYLEQLPEADRAVQIAAEMYERLGDIERQTKALFLRGNIKYESREIEGAAPLFRRVIAYGEAESKQEWVASGSYALGNCALESGDVEGAAVLFSTALRIYRDKGPEYLAHASWGMARVLLARGMYAESLRRLNAGYAHFTERGMIVEASVSALDAIEAMVEMRMFKQAADLARSVFKTFNDVGLMTSALTAIAYIETAATEQRLSREVVQEVRQFMKRVDREPHLLFIPPPEPSR